jgi:hypothetical protein
MLMSKPLAAGSDGMNATEQLYDLVGDDQLFDLIDSLAAADPDANIWEDPRIISRLEELGIEVPTTTEPEPAEQPPVPDLDNQEPAAMNESVMSEADLVIQDLINGELDAYNLMNHPTTPSEQYVSKIMHDMYDDVGVDHGLHPDDDSEKILDMVVDRLSHDYGHSPEVDEGENLATFEEQDVVELQTPGAIGFFNEELARLKLLALLK